MPKKSGGGSAKILHAPSPWPGCLPAGRMGTRSWALWQGAHRLKLKERRAQRPALQASVASLGTEVREEGEKEEGREGGGRREKEEGGTHRVSQPTGSPGLRGSHFCCPLWHMTLFWVLAVPQVHGASVSFL